MSEETKQKAAFRLVGITTEEFATFRENYDDENPKLEVGLNLQIKANRDGRLIGLFTRFNFNQKESPILILESACHFQIEENYWESIQKNEEILLPSTFVTHLLVIAVGTARGIIHAKKPAWLENLVLTTLDVSKVFGEEDVHVTLNEGEMES